jgi:hypothetical protein
MEKNDCRTRGCWWMFGLVATMVAVGSASRADVVEMVNGDHYSGTVISVTMTNLVLRSSVQGLITLPREKLASIRFGELAPKAASSALSPSAVSKLPPAAGVMALAQRLVGTSGDTNQTNRTAEQLLENAGPEASQRYNQMVRGLLTGSLSVAELRKQAQQTISEAEKAKEELGPEAGDILDGYLSILRQFLQEPAPK